MGLSQPAREGDRQESQGTVTQVVECLYDVFNRRIGRKLDTSAPFDMANAVIERYVLDDIHNGLSSADGGNVVLDFVDPDGSGAQAIAMSKRYLYGEAVDQLFAQEDLSKTLGRHQSQPVAIGGSSGHGPRPGQAGRDDRRSLQV